MTTYLGKTKLHRRKESRPTFRLQLLVTTLKLYQILNETLDENEETKLIGDSIIREQLVEFCGRSSSYRKRHCIPGAGLDDITTAYDEITKCADDNTLLFIHSGTNDRKHTRSKALLPKYREIMNKYKVKFRNIIVSDILPRINAENRFYDKAFNTNSRKTLQRRRR